jgi:hypothetical protein
MVNNLINVPQKLGFGLAMCPMVTSFMVKRFQARFQILREIFFYSISYSPMLV